MNSQLERPPLVIVDYLDSNEREEATPAKTEPLPESFGRNLDTITKARTWLTNPHNWFDSELFILQWDGLIPKVSRRHGMRLIKEPWDDGLPWCVVYEQKVRRKKKDSGEELDEREARESEPSVEA